MSIVWVDVYKMTANDPPRINWVEGSNLNCHQAEGFLYQGQCDAGLFDQYEYQASIAFWPGCTYHVTAFAHELNHARLFRLTGDPDGNHTDPSWAAGGLLETANSRLGALNL